MSGLPTLSPAEAVPRRLVALAILATSLAVGCGGSFVFFSNTNGRFLLAVNVTPSSGDPLHAPAGQVQFSASGTFNAAPTPVNPLPGVVWTVDHPFFSTQPDLGRASITGNGIAQCGPGFVGTVTVFATAPIDPTMPLSQTNQMAGTALLVCP